MAQRKPLTLAPPPPHTPTARARYAKAFPHGRSLLLVIRPQHGLPAALRSLEVAVKGGADGVVICNHDGISAEVALALALGLRAAHPFLWVGLHLLDLPVAQALQFPGVAGLGGLFEEDAGVDALYDPEYEDAREASSEARTHHRWEGLHYGGAGYRPLEGIPAGLVPRVVQRAASFVDVVMLTGNKPQVVIPPARVEAARAALGDHPVAVASGVTPENCGNYLPHADSLVVCTGAESGPGVFDAARVKALAAAVRAFNVSATAPANAG